MSDKERELLRKLDEFPPELRVRFFDRLEGAAMAMEALKQNKQAE